MFGIEDPGIWLAYLLAFAMFNFFFMVRNYQLE